MTKYTPGPWRVAAPYMRWPGVEADDCSIVVCDDDEDSTEGVRGETAEIALANAQLIAAAPEMFDALHQYRSDLKRPPQADSIGRRFAMIDRLIAKATGQE